MCFEIEWLKLFFESFVHAEKVFSLTLPLSGRQGT